jgi:hypothetical protein
MVTSRDVSRDDKMEWRKAKLSEKKSKLYCEKERKNRTVWCKQIRIIRQFISLRLFSLLCVPLLISLIPWRNRKTLATFLFLFFRIFVAILSPATEAIISPSRQKYITIGGPFLIQFVLLFAESPNQFQVLPLAPKFAILHRRLANI